MLSCEDERGPLTAWVVATLHKFHWVNEEFAAGCFVPKEREAYLYALFSRRGFFAKKANSPDFAVQLFDGYRYF
ncbi:MAG: hypothetical protein RL150_67 [Candidatus Parcubacteria bacterium]|jgi:hypothetical protein